MRDQYLRSLLPRGDETIAGQLEKHVLKPMLAILTIYKETKLKRELKRESKLISYERAFKMLENDPCISL